MIEQFQTQIRQIEKTIDTMEDALDEREFQDYCDNAYSCISYLRQSIAKLRNNVEHDG